MPRARQAVRVAHRSRAILAALAAAIAPARTLAAQAAPGAPVMWPISDGREAVPVVFTASGGISLGSYQAGVTWALMRFMRMANDDSLYRRARRIPYFQLSAVTGASAGNINAVMTAIEWCTPTPDDLATLAPERSLYYRTWVNVGWEQLFPRQRDPRENGVLDRTFYNRALYPEIRRRMDGAVDPNCRGLPVGITITRVVPQPLQVAERIAVPTQRMATVMVIDTLGAPGAARPLEFRQAPHYFRKASLGALVAPAMGGSSRITRDSLFRFIEASSAYPVAFGPRTLHTFDGLRLDPDDDGCPHAGAGRVECAAPDAVSYTDGGVFDNNPLALALELYRLSPTTIQRRYEARPYANDSSTLLTGVAKETQVQSAPGRWRSVRLPLVGSASLSTHADSLRLPVVAARAVYIANNTLRERLAAQQVQRQEVTEFGGLDAVFKLLSGAVPSARSYELQSLARLMARDGPGSFGMVEPTTRALPVMGEHLGAFGAFFGRPFRAYDFYVGAYDGLHYVAESILCGGGRDTGGNLKRCTMRELEALLQDPRFPSGPVLPYLARDLSAGDTNQSNLPAWPSGAMASADDSLHLVMLKRIAYANRSVVDDPPRTTCSSADWVRQALCKDGFDAVLQRVSGPETRAIAERWRKRCSPRPRYDLDSIAGLCRGDHTFEQMLANRYAFSRRVALEAGKQLLEGEYAQKRQGRADHVLLVKAGLVTMASLDGPSRRGFDFDPASIPGFVKGKDRVLLMLVPEHIAFRAFGRTTLLPGHEVNHTGGWEAGRRILYHGGENLAVAFPFGYSRWRSFDSTGAHGRSNVMLGAGIVLKTGGRFARPLVPWLTQLQYSERYHARIHSREPHWTFAESRSRELAAYALAGKLRFGVSTLPRLYERRGYAVSAGISDVPSLFYLLPLFH